MPGKDIDDINEMIGVVPECEPYRKSWNRIKKELDEGKKPIPNKASPKLLNEMEQFAVMCNRAGNGKDARLVRSWAKQLSGE